MDMVKLFHMNGGIGDASYASNSTLQRKGISMTRPIIEEAINDLCSSSVSFPKTLTMADLGCSSGPNTLLVASVLINAVDKISLKMGHKSPEIQMNLNDLPSNDFNTVFLSIQEFEEKQTTVVNGVPPSCYFAGVPGSFYGRLFPSQTLHFVHSSYSLQWLSKIPQAEDINKGNIYFSSTTPKSVIRAFHEQFQEDFSEFLRCRSEEMVPGGRMVLTLSGRRSDDPCSKECCNIWGFFAMALNDMVSEGLIEEEKLDSFNLPQYAASPTEIKNEVEKEGSFTIDRLEIRDVNWRAWKPTIYDENEPRLGENGATYKTVEEVDARGHDVAKGIRAGIEQLVLNHFGDTILDEVFARYEKILANRMSKEEKTAFVTVTISLTRKG